MQIIERLLGIHERVEALLPDDFKIIVALYRNVPSNSPDGTAAEGSAAAAGSASIANRGASLSAGAHFSQILNDVFWCQLCMHQY